MSLPYVRPYEALRPSGLRLLETDPVLFYQRFLGPPEQKPPFVQGFAAALGCAFHARCEAHALGRAPDWETVKIEGEERWRALGLSEVAFRRYLELYGRKMPRPKGVEVELSGFVPGTSVPIAGRADVVLRGRVIHDYKTTSAPQPRPGYSAVLGNHSKRPRAEREVGVHVDAGRPLEEVNEDWADQLAIYGWCLGRQIRTAKVSVDQILIDRETGDVRITQFRTTITTAHQKKLRERCLAAWERIQSESVVPEDVASRGSRFLEMCT